MTCSRPSWTRSGSRSSASGRCGRWSRRSTACATCVTWRRSSASSSGSAVTDCSGPTSTTTTGTPTATSSTSPRAVSACPDESYYRDEKFAEIREKYVAYLATLLALAGHDDPEGAAATVVAHRHPAGPGPLGACRDPRRPEDLQPAHGRRAARAVPGLRLGRLRPQPECLLDGSRRAAVRELRATAVVLRAPVRGPARGPDRRLARVAAHPRPPVRGAVPVRRSSSRPTSTSTGAPSTAPRSCAPAGSAASRSSRVPSARRSARSTSRGTSRRPPRR